MKVGDRVRYRETPQVGTVEVALAGQWGIRWDDHAARGWGTEQLDLFSHEAAGSLLHICRAETEALRAHPKPPGLTRPVKPPAAPPHRTRYTTTEAQAHDEALDACLVLLRSEMERRKVIICVEALREKPIVQSYD